MNSFCLGETEDDQSIESIQFEFDTIKIATNNFSDANKLWEGGFGPVYKVYRYETHISMTTAPRSNFDTC